MKITRECEMAEPVMRWLHCRGFTPYGEVPWFGRGIDVVGIDAGGTIETVEMKLCLSNGVIYQANCTLSAADRAWCAVATSPRSLANRIESGWLKNVGVLRVAGGVVEVLHEAPPPKERRSERWAESITKACERMEPFGAAGLPTMLGVGPAQAVFNSVQKYREANPNAPWTEIFQAVPNHYKHPRSMQGAMGVVAAVRERRLAIAAKLKAKE